jgi:Leucine-rich repeat (LRR) protein
MLDIGTDLEPHLRLYLANNRFTIVPTPVLELQNLRVLSLRHNKLKSIPSTIRNLINLESLNVAGNLLNELPYEVIELVREHSLRELTLDPNPWKQLHQDEVFNYPVHSADAPEEISPTEPRDRFLQFLTPITQAATPVTRTNPSPQVPSLTEMALRQLARFDAQNNIDFKSLMPLASPETVLNHLDLLHQQPGRRCTRCRRQIVLAEEEWLEWWYLNMNDRLFSIANYKPYRRLGCRRGCQGPH